MYKCVKGLAEYELYEYGLVKLQTVQGWCSADVLEVVHMD